MLEKKVHKSKEYRIKQIVVICLTIILLLMSYLSENANFFFRAVPVIEFLILFYLIDHFFQIKFKHRHYLFIIIIALSGILLSPLFFIYPNYDKVQHFIQPIFVNSIILFMVSKLNLKPKWKLVFAFFITIAILGLFEVGEFGLDKFFDMKLQGVYLRDIQGLEKFNIIMDPIDDTMIDLMLGIFGAIIYTFFAYFLMRK